MSPDPFFGPAEIDRDEWRDVPYRHRYVRGGFEGTCEAPPGAGSIVAAEWDFDGSGQWPVSDPSADGSRTALTSTPSFAYASPGTYFATFRAGLRSEGATHAPLRLVTNLARVRVVVRA